MSNNSVFASSVDELPPAFWDGYRGNGEPYGLLNIDAARRWGRYGEERPDDGIVGYNPCGEIALHDRECCNLSDLFLPNIDSEEQLKEVATLFYKVQKAIAALPYLDDVTTSVVRRNMRLGVGVSGVMQAPRALDWLDATYRHLRELDAEWSASHGWPESIRLTTVKPSGSVAILSGVTPGVHPGFSQFHIRRVRMSYSDPLVEYCRERGYHWEHQRDFDGTDNLSTVVVEFPCEFPEETTFANETSAIDQLEMVKRLQTEWADNAVSVTCYLRPHELEGVQEWLRENLGAVKSISFLPYSEHGFDQAPLEEITEERYRSMIDALSTHAIGAMGLSGEMVQDLIGCETGACPVR